MVLAEKRKPSPASVILMARLSYERQALIAKYKDAGIPVATPAFIPDTTKEPS